MRSFMKAASLVVMATLGLLAPAAYAQDPVDAYSKSGVAGGFKDSINSLSNLSVGPYPSNASNTYLPLAAGISDLNKRQYYCDPGYGRCNNNYCCPLNKRCAPSGGCCPMNLPWECGRLYCCPYDSCLPSGHCGCYGNLYRCGNNCCKYGCDDVGGCACGSTYPVDCGNDYCCPAGTICASGGKCMAAAPPPKPSTSISSTSAPRPDGSRFSSAAMGMMAAVLVL